MKVYRRIITYITVKRNIKEIRNGITERWEYNIVERVGETGWNREEIIGILITIQIEGIWERWWKKEGRYRYEQKETYYKSIGWIIIMIIWENGLGKGRWWSWEEGNEKELTIEKINSRWIKEKIEIILIMKQKKKERGKRYIIMMIIYNMEIIGIIEIIKITIIYEIRRYIKTVKEIYTRERI